MIASDANPAVAVIVPVFNRLELLRQTVASLRSQTMADAEFILVDDRSDEATWNYLQSLPAQDPRFRVLRKQEGQSRGCQGSRNMGFEACRAEALVFLDSDDLLAPDCLEARYRELSAHPAADLLVGRQAMFWDDPVSLRWVNVPLPSRPDLDRCLDLLEPLDVPWVNGGVMIRTARLREAGVVWSTEFHWDDLAFHFSCLVRGLRVVWMGYGDKPPDSYYRKHGGEHYGQTLQTPEGLRNCARLIAWMKAQLGEAGEWTAQRRHALLKSFFHLCILQPVDHGEYCLAAELLETAADGGLMTRNEQQRFRVYASIRRLLQSSARATYFWNRLMRRTLLRNYFSNTPWTYGSVCPPSPVSEQALGKVLGLASGVIASGFQSPE